MLVSEFDYFLPEELIASHPLERRDSSRMLVAYDDILADLHISDFIKFLREGDVVVFNDSRVIPARFNATSTDGKIYEITLHTHDADKSWWGLARKFQKLNIDDVLTLDNGAQIRVADKSDESGILVEFLCDDVMQTLDAVGKMPLPPYMKRDEETEDRERYQTIYADPTHLGSMAAPTAGLHFTPELLAAIENAGAKIVKITLHVGAGTFLPVKVDDTINHKMHSEFGVITDEQAEIINNASRVVAVGTTSLRLLESAAQDATNGRVVAFAKSTNIFITPGYKFRAVDVLLTNFHLPKSTLFMLVSAFAGLPEMKAAYAYAVENQYRFFSYGDCCLLFRKDNV